MIGAMVAPAPMHHREGPYRSPGRAVASDEARAGGWMVFAIDALVVLGIASAVMMVPRWPALIDGAARGFLGF